MIIQRLRNVDAGRYVSSEGLTIVRSISAFEATDVLHQSQLDPRAFVNEDSGMLELPSMLWQLSNDRWLAVEDATVGYGGTGLMALSEFPQSCSSEFLGSRGKVSAGWCRW